MTASGVAAAAAGCLGGRCDWRYLRGCQQQIQADGLWLRQVSTFSCDAKETWPCVCIDVFQSLCVQCENLPVLFAKTCLVCACVNPPGWQEFLLLSANLYFVLFWFFCVCFSPTWFCALIFKVTVNGWKIKDVEELYILYTGMFLTCRHLGIEAVDSTGV